MKDIKQILLANQAWALEHRLEDAEFFTRQVGGQRPQMLWIGSSDSRVSPEQLTQAAVGRIFIHRNVGNLVSESDLNLMAAVQYALERLEVPDIVVCGHYGCSGVRAAVLGGVDGPLHDWLAPLRQVYADHADELAPLADDDTRLARLVELNVRDQLVRLARVPVVQAAFGLGRNLTLHGWVYDVRDGRLKPLMQIDRTTRLDDIGRPGPVLLAGTQTAPAGAGGAGDATAP